METELVGFGCRDWPQQRGYIMETENRPALDITDSLLVPGNVIVARNRNGKLIAAESFTREELQLLVQQAHDRYGVVADPFASPGSGDVDPFPDHVGYGVPA